MGQPTTNRAKRRLWLSGVGTLLAMLTVSGGPTSFAAEPRDPKGVVFFETKIRPVLVAECYSCHSQKAGNPKGGLLVDSREGLRKGGESGPAVLPGNPDDSPILEALRHEGLAMPPTKQLSERVIADFETWIRMGAPDPREKGSESSPAVLDVAAARRFWSFQPTKPVVAPSVENRAWPRSDIDRYVLAGLEAHQLHPVADADRRTLIRRLSFDLLGLPPTPEEVQAFVNDTAPDALERLVDRLLDSPHFGERWARHWLDVARYAESNGNTDNVTYPNAWRYRDYVIKSFQIDKPYNQFIREQVAGDLLPADNARQRDEQLVATGFLAIGPKPRVQNNPDFQMDVVAEQIEVTTSGFMALTVGCARCHDHKFDPIPMTEYYALAGIFTSTETLYSDGGGKGNGKLANTGFHHLQGDTDKSQAKRASGDELVVVKQRQQGVVSELRQLGALAANDKGSGDKGSNAKPNGANKNSTNGKKPPNKKKDNKPADAKKVALNSGPGNLANNDSTSDDGLSADNKTDKKKAKKAAKQNASQPSVAELLKAAQVPANATPKVKGQIQRKMDELKTLLERERSLRESQKTGEELAMGVRDAKKIDDCQLCIRGESKQRGDRVPRALVSVATIDGQPDFSRATSGRLELANWIASPKNPLTARVLANRVWHHLFGRGIVTSVDNFGALGAQPSHPELLDDLALGFIADGWSVKRLIKRIVLSRTYGLSSDHDASNYEKDPDNVYLWRHASRRLDAEALRDAMLRVSGRLEPRPPQGSPVSRLGEQVVQNNKGKRVELSGDEDRHRSIYLPVLRNAMPEVLELFDAPDPSLVVGARDATNVPAQSLYLMNSPFVVEQSRTVAQRLLAGEGARMSDAERIEKLFEAVLIRPPRATEFEQTQRFVQHVRKSLTSRKPLPSGTKPSGTPADPNERIWAAVAQALIESAEFRYVE